MRIGQRSSETAGPILCGGIKAMPGYGIPATSNRHRRPVSGVRTGAETVKMFLSESPLSSVCGTENDALRHHAIAHEAP
jgi:hypothetical protein